MAKQTIKRKISIFNLLISLICVLSISAYLFMPFWKITLSYHAEKATLQTFFEKILTEEENPKENASTAMPIEENTENPDSIPSDLDYETILQDAIPEEGLPLSLSLTFKANEILSFLDKDATKSVEKLVESNVTTLIEELSEPIDKIAEGIVRETSKQTFKSIVAEQVQQAFKEQSPDTEKTDEDVQQYLDNAGLTDAYITQEAEKITKLLTNGTPSVSQVTDEIIHIADDMMNKLAASDTVFENRTLTEENKAEIKNTVADALKTFTNDNDEVDIGGLLSYALNFLKQAPEETPAPQENESASILLINESSDSSSPSTQEKEEATEKDLEDALRDALMDMLTEKDIKNIATTMKVISYVLLFSVFTWAYLIVKILLKSILKKNNAVKLGVPIWFGWLPFTALYLLPVWLMNMLKNPPAMLGAELVNTLKKLEGFSANFNTSAWIAFACAIVLFILSFFYRKNRKKLKILLQAEAIEAKEAKKQEKKEEK